MVRIVAGKHKGRKLEVLDSKQLRPTSSRTRESIFNILNHGHFAGDEKPLLEDAKVLDLFCGSGALGLEALSHGASHAVFIDVKQEHLALVRDNAAHLGESENVTFIRSDSSSPPVARFACDVVFVDPPYHRKLIEPALKNLGIQGWLHEGSVIVVEMDKRENLPEVEGYTLLKARNYGRTTISILEWKPA